MTRLVLEGVAGKNTTAFLDALTVGEIGAALLAKSDDGYNVIVGSTADQPRLFNDYSQHPRVRVFLPRLSTWSTAAGRYQFIFSTWQEVAAKLGLKDFSPVSQDLAAIERIRFRGALADVRAGRFADAIHKCRQEWASLPGAGYGQGEVKLAALQARYVASGGVLV
jgi:muramidase (phage lysozyme)